MALKSDIFRVQLIVANLDTIQHLKPEKMSIAELVAFAKKRSLDLTNAIERTDILSLVEGARHDSCPLCMEEFKEGQWIKETNCGHHFHIGCLQEAAVAKASTKDHVRTQELACPLCRQRMWNPECSSKKRAREKDQCRNM